MGQWTSSTSSTHHAPSIFSHTQPPPWPHAPLVKGLCHATAHPFPTCGRRREAACVSKRPEVQKWGFPPLCCSPTPTATPRTPRG